MLYGVCLSACEYSVFVCSTFSCLLVYDEVYVHTYAIQFTTKISAIMDTKRRSATVQDGQKKKVTITKDNFSALHVSH